MINQVIPPNSSLILKCKYKDSYFICNRNEKQLFIGMSSSTYVQWWGIPEHFIGSFIYTSDIDVLEVIRNCSNTFLKDQKQLNKIKAIYKKADPDVDENEKICDIAITECFSEFKKSPKFIEWKNRLRKGRNFIKNKYNTYIGSIRRLPVDFNLLAIQYFSVLLQTPRFRFPSFKRFKNNNYKKVADINVWIDDDTFCKYLYVYILEKKDFLLNLYKTVIK